MGGFRILGSCTGGWWRGLGAHTPPRDAGYSAKSRHRLQPQGSSKRSGVPRDQPFPGVLQLKTLSREELVGVLREAVVDKKGPLLTLNKPQGLPVTGKPGELTLLSVLPELSHSLGLSEQDLHVVRAAGKEASGLVLLSSCPQTASRLQKFFIHSRKAQRPTATYCAITDGIPATSEGKIQAALRLECSDGLSLVVPVKSPSRKDILEGVRRTHSHFRVMATGSGCALVQLQPLTAFPDQLQVHMMLQLCPLLGDHTYSARMGTVLGQRFLFSAQSTKPQRQVLDEALLRCLHLTPSQASQLPLHLHLHSLLLPGPRPRDTPMELLAPLPPYFSRTLQYLGLCQHRPLFLTPQLDTEGSEGRGPVTSQVQRE
ncbi:RNA pseudouridylate synthase domain-containing protein 3 [Sciurus carolinensis]|uniref:RNA pseudouridylate synthase domain-containing protein 3 n=1 Tax=Sciurus carolinensis TaxID=30640 RepID=A0AA41MNP7_SCICA|nr:RNA pseudouridylate synthase domain-containing protein 3 [Sciurus carolinensis]